MCQLFSKSTLILKYEFKFDLMIKLTSENSNLRKYIFRIIDFTDNRELAWIFYLKMNYL